MGALGSIMGALKAIMNVIAMAKMTPPIKDLLPRLAPILMNKHEKVPGGTAVRSIWLARSPTEGGRSASRLVSGCGSASSCSR